MLGLALLTILLLVWNAWSVHKRGQFGRKASAASRYPIVVGRGGRCLGALITAIVEAAAAGGNLLLLALDISRDRQVSDQPALLT